MSPSKHLEQPMTALGLGLALLGACSNAPHFSGHTVAVRIGELEDPVMTVGFTLQGEGGLRVHGSLTPQTRPSPSTGCPVVAIHDLGTEVSAVLDGQQMKLKPGSIDWSDDAFQGGEHEYCTPALSFSLNLDKEMTSGESGTHSIEILVGEQVLFTLEAKSLHSSPSLTLSPKQVIHGGTVNASLHPPTNGPGHVYFSFKDAQGAGIPASGVSASNTSKVRLNNDRSLTFELPTSIPTGTIEVNAGVGRAYAPDISKCEGVRCATDFDFQIGSDAIISTTIEVIEK